VTRQISPERKGAYYFGMALIVVGFLSFASTFFSFASQFGHPGRDFERFGSSVMMRGVIGVALIGMGGFLMKMGRVGMAGSGILLDPERAREDVEPWSRMAGGVVKDALDEADIKPGGQKSAEPMSFDEELRRLRKLRDEQIISEDEYAAKKKQILERA
jgi:hypothetical protein